MRYLTWVVLLITLIVFGSLVYFFDYRGFIALSIHYVRITVVIAALLIFLRMAPVIFKEVPTPRRDYLFAAINFFLLSAGCISFLNGAGFIFGVDTSIFSSPVAGLFSIFLIFAAVFAIIAPDTGGNKPKIVAVAVGAAVSIGLVFVAPYFVKPPEEPSTTIDPKDPFEIIPPK